MRVPSTGNRLSRPPRLHILPAALLLALTARAETAFVTDDLVLTVYADKSQQGARVATLHSGARLEVLGKEGDYTQVRLPSGGEGWVRSSFLVDREPAGVRLKAAEEELARLKAAGAKSPPTRAAGAAAGLAASEAAARAEGDALRQRLDATQKELDTLKALPPPAPPPRGWLGPVIVSGLLCLAAGFGWGYLTLARRIRARFGGVKVF